jgi:hypothetical protein
LSAAPSREVSALVGVEGSPGEAKTYDSHSW